ncbi:MULTISPECIES: RNA 2'-phosphotransferase [Pseudomonas]|jgi:putative RNA 2'-phosphotransferase|uniref:Probable RNA 2'-phosphotransferase n=1 Tax=Pseudomonas aphyarum TaxID=2942629 RepID=A0ABT5PN82_9PSED|nr:MULTISPECIES: RNA 2'-phosphotransferase [Pseudomonas]MBP3997138.1 RNA 2'-phosphotransferase [Pseudomonas koreensis]MDD0971475.1 RNA 2'-phosphotransferase [Pseudomonas aphyarum]MDD1125373.1 RNA 2'-phosphotransferase [Pseudomonas aphyarum]TFA81632.1 putative RNA 2'-phosphotransferase [Pseudomonas sp. LAIL14HWK12:I2]SCZ27300.1 putative RNA 2'-phosphotransferase [Pseudomonas sp. NFIX46]
MTGEVDRLSKTMSFLLRHKPESVGLHLDSEGWARLDSLLIGMQKLGVVADDEVVKRVVLGSDKRRFEISEDGVYVRAVQGHSSKLVTRDYPVVQPPCYLYHGTAYRFVDSIFKEGLQAGARHYVHLTENKGLAFDVGQRYGSSVVLRVKSHEMFLDGFVFFRAENNVWLISSVPPEYLDKI